MELLSLHTEIETEDGSYLWCSYRLIQDNLPGGDLPTYGIECLLEGMAEDSPTTHVLLRGISTHQQLVEAMVWQLARGQVLPIHITDIITDFVG